MLRIVCDDVSKLCSAGVVYARMLYLTATVLLARLTNIRETLHDEVVYFGLSIKSHQAGCRDTAIQDPILTPRRIPCRSRGRPSDDFC